MNSTNLAYAEEQENWNKELDSMIEQKTLSESTWNYFVKEMKKVFRFTYKETKWFKNCKTAKLIATIPFAAGCDAPERTAILHLCIYIAEIRGFQKYYAHLPNDDLNIFKRLDAISTFEGGDKDIIEHGMYLLARIMIEGYHKSEEADKKNNVYNPFVSGAWNYEEKRETIADILNKNPNSIMDDLIGEENFWR